MADENLEQIKKHNQELFLKSSRQEAIKIALAMRPDESLASRVVGEEPREPYNLLIEAEKIYVWLTKPTLINEKELVKEVLNYWLISVEVDNLQLQKEEMIKSQKFEGASLIRDKEKELQNKLPSVERIKELRNLL